MKQKILHITDEQVRKRVSVDKSIELAREAYVKMAEKKTTSPERVWLTTTHGTSVYCMPAHIHGTNSVAVKIVRQNPRNPANFLPSVLATIHVFDSHTGQELAQIEADTLTALRTAASSAIATDLLASKSATTLGIFGTGRQAEAHIPTINRVRKLSKVAVYSRNRRRRETFAQKMSRKCRLKIEPASSPEEVVKSSEILVLATNSKVPLFRGSHVRPGTHVNAIGGALPDTREMDTRLVERSFLVVDSKPQAVNSYGDIAIPLREGAIREKDLTELGALLVRPGSVGQGDKRITVFKSGGLAVLDAIVADFLVSSLAQ